MRKCLLILFFAFAAAGASAAQIDTVAVFSAKMQREIPALVVVPDAGVGRRMPVLYLLHGFGGSYTTWQNITDLRPLADACGMIVVCPDGANSWYWDSPLDPASQFETFVAQELPDWIDARYLTIPSREGRAVTGLSMGGHGALWVALRHKDRFGAAGSTSGGVDIRPFPDSWEMKKQLGELKDNPERWNAHTVIRQAASLRDGELALIFDCGYQDFFYQVNLNLHEQLMRQGVGHDFLVRPGAHNAAYWSASLPCQMLFFQRWFARNAPQPAVTASGRRVVYIGDSITDGNWGKANGKPSSQRNLWDRNHLFGSGYMYLCASYYQGYFPDRDYRFFNRGVGGHALGDLAARWQEDVIDLRPDVLSVFVGTNDAERHLGRLLRADDPKTVPDFDFADWERTYRGLLDQARQANPAVGAARFSVPGRQPSAGAHRRFADGQLACFGIGGPLGERPRVAPGVAEAREDAVFRIVGHREGPALDGLGLVEQRFVGCGEPRVPGRRFVASVAVRFAFRGPAAAERRRFRLGREVPPFLEIPAFVLLVGHDELLGQRRASVDQEGAFFGHGDAEALLGGRTSRFDFQFRHTICVSDSLGNRRQ